MKERGQKRIHISDSAWGMRDCREITFRTVFDWEREVDTSNIFDSAELGYLSPSRRYLQCAGRTHHYEVYIFLTVSYVRLCMTVRKHWQTQISGSARLKKPHDLSGGFHIFDSAIKMPHDDREGLHIFDSYRVGGRGERRIKRSLQCGFWEFLTVRQRTIFTFWGVDTAGEIIIFHTGISSSNSYENYGTGRTCFRERDWRSRHS